MTIIVLICYICTMIINVQVSTITEGTKNALGLISFILELVLLIIYIFSFDLNSTKIRYLKELITCSRSESKDNLLEIRYINEDNFDDNNSIY